MRQPMRTATATTVWIGLGALLAAVIVWQAWIAPEAGQADAMATAQTPAAVATPAMGSTPLASPAASSLPPPTALPLPPPPAPMLSPPAAMGQPVPYGDDWTITATSISLTPRTPIWDAKGTFAVVALTIENRGPALSGFPFDDLRLEAAGRLYAPDFGASNTTGAGYFQGFPPAEPQETAIVFDIPADAVGPFILQSATDPNFRILVQQMRRG